MHSFGRIQLTFALLHFVLQGQTCLLLQVYFDFLLSHKQRKAETKVHILKATVFAVVTYGCESWTVKKVEHQRIDAFKLWCWRRLLKVPWIARRSTWNIHWKDYNAEAEALVFSSSDAKRGLIEKFPDARKDRGQKEKRASG